MVSDAGRQVNVAHTAMLDVVFEASGGPLPGAYPYALWDELERLAPGLATSPDAGVIPMRLAESEEGMLLPRRTKLTLRLPRNLVDDASGLAQQTLHVAGNELRLGACSTRPLQPYPTLHAQLVAGAEDESAFVAEVEDELAAMGAKASLICGQHHTLADGQRRMSGYSLVLHDLAPADSLQLQCTGLGAGRRYGCGIFMPYKAISGLG